MAASISLNADDLGCWMKSCRGEIPPPLVGASLTFYEPDKTSSASSPSPKIFLFGGRLVDERKMMNHLYMLDTKTFVWTLIVGNGEGEETRSPTPRYFHSIDVWRDNLVLFGGMGYSTFVDSSPTPTLVGLSDLYFFHIPSSTWRLPNPSPTSSAAFAPIQRYAHISAVTANRLVIVGGQDVKAAYVQDIGVFDLQREEWIASQGMGGGRVEERGMYRSACVAGEKGRTAEREEGETKQDIMLYSNYNFTDVRRVLEVLHPDGPAPSESFTLTDRSEEMRGQGIKGSGPQGLRFPSGARLGNWLLFGGIYLASSVQEYCLWALDLKTLEWQPVEIGGASCLKTGSWNRGILDPIYSSYLIFGSKRTNMLEDYNKRATNYSHIVSVDLESFGIYRQPSTSGLDQRAKNISFSELEDEATTDFEMVCEDGRRLRCSRRVLEERWPWFAAERMKYNNLASSPESSSFPAPPRSSSSTQSLPRARVRNSQIHLQEPYPVALALLQYFYTYALDTPVQNAPPVLSSLLIMSQQYDLPHLQKLVLHRMHVALGPDSAEGIAEVASICQCESLCIRAWRILGSGRIAGATGALAAVRMSRGGSGSGMGGGGSERNMSHDSGFESSNGLGVRGGSGRGSGNGGSRMTSGQPMSVYGLNDSRPPISRSGHDPLPRRGSEPPATIRRGSTPPPPSPTDSSTSSSFGSQPRQRTISAGSSIESPSPSTSPARATLANPGPGFLKGRDRAYSVGRTALVPSPLSMSSTPASIEISRAPSLPRRMSTSTSGTTADMARSPDRYTSDSSHSLGPYTPNEQESFPFPNPQEKTISSTLQAIDGNYSQASFISRTTTASTESSSGIDTGSEWPVSSKRDSLALPISGETSPGFPSPASESGSNTTSSTLEPVRRGSFAISKVFSRKKREDTGLGSPAFAAASSKIGGGAAGSGSARSAGASAPEVSQISRAFGWKHQFKDEFPKPPPSSLPPKPSPTYSAGGAQQHINGLFDAPSSSDRDRPDFKRRGWSDPPSIHTISPPTTIRTRPSSADSDDTLSTLAAPPTPAPFGMTPRSTTTMSSSNKTSHNSSAASPFHLLPNRQPSFSYPTRPPLLNRASMNTLTPAASVLSSIESSGSSRNSSSNSSSSGKKSPPTVYMYGRGGAGRVAAPKPEKTAAEKIAEKEEKKAKKEEKKRAEVFAKNSNNPNRYPPGMVLVGSSGGLALPEKREGATGLV